MKASSVRSLFVRLKDAGAPVFGAALSIVVLIGWAAPPVRASGGVDSRLLSVKPPKRAKPGDRGSKRKQADKVKIDPAVQKRIDELLAREKAAKRRAKSTRRGAKRPTPGGRRPAGAKNKRKPAAPKKTAPPPVRPTLGRRGRPLARPGANAGKEINIPAPEEAVITVPPEERTYSFSIKNGTYEQLMEGVSRQTGLGVIGEAPKDGRVNFVTDQVLNFDEMLKRVRMLLFHYKVLDPYWVNYKDGHLEIGRVTDWYRKLGKDRMFASEEAFREAGLVSEDLALVVFTPPPGSVAKLKEVRNFMPDYVRVAPIGGQNRITIFALVKDINYYLWLINFIPSDADSRPIEVIGVQHLTPGDAVDKLNVLMGRESAAPRRGGGTTRRAGTVGALETLVEPDVTIMPVEERHAILVRAMPEKIDEIKFLLTFIDIKADENFHTPVIIDLERAEPNDLINTLNQILTATASPVTSGAAKKARAARKRKGSSSPGVRAGEITLIPHPSRNAIIVLSDEEGLARVRGLVAMFDDASEKGPMRLAVENIGATDAIAMMTLIMVGEGKIKGAVSYRLVPDASDRWIWFSGTAQDLRRVEQLLTVLDVAGEPVSLHTFDLVCEQASFVVSMLRAYESGGVAAPKRAAAAIRKNRPGKGRTSNAGAAEKYTADDDSDRVYALCTEDDWQELLPIIEQLDQVACDPRGPFVRLEVEHVKPEELTGKIVDLLSGREDAGSIRFLPTDDALLVAGASESLLKDIRTILEELDQPIEITKRTFVIRHADPAEIHTAIETFIFANTDKPAKSKVRRGSSKGRDRGPAVLEGTPERTRLTMVRLGNRLVIHATPETMERVAALIAEFDVVEHPTELRVYNDFSPSADIQGIASQLATVLGGTAGVPAPGRRKGKSEWDGPRFAAQPQSGKLVVIAEPESFPRIEELLLVLQASDDVEPVLVEFVPVSHADPQELVTLLDPLLAMKVRRLVASGKLVEPPAVGGPAKPNIGKRKRSSMGDRYHLEPDARNRRIAVAGPRVIIDEATRLIVELDTPTENRNLPIIRTVELHNATAAEIVAAVGGIMGGPSSRPRKTGKIGVSTASEGPEGLRITEVPGGGAVVLHGRPEDVEEAVDWIRKIDDQAETGRLVKVYELKCADIETMASLIMNAVDQPGKTAGAQRTRRLKGAADTPDEEDEDPFSSVKTHVGYDVFLRIDTFTKIMIAAAPRAKLAQIDALVKQLDDPEACKQMEEPTLPSFTYELKYKDPFDASFDLEMVFEALWEPADLLPKVDYAPFGEFLVIRYPDESRFDEIREIISKYVDTLDPKLTEKKRRKFAPPDGIKPEEALLWLAKHYPDEVEIVSAPGAKPEEYDIQQITPPKRKGTPCVLPTAFAAMTASLFESAQQAVGKDKSPRRRPGHTNRKGRKDADGDSALIQAGLKALDGGAKASDEAEHEKDRHRSEDHAKPRVPGKTRCYVDPKDGVLVCDGPAALVDGMEDRIKELKDEMEGLPEKPDIRIYRVRYIDIYEAKDIIEEMFNTPKQQRAQIQRAQQLQMVRARQLQQQQLRAAQQRAQGQQGQPGQGGQQGRKGQQPPVAGQINVPQLPKTSVRVMANPRDRTLILRASSSQYPEILKLLATIDQPKPIKSELKVFPLKNVSAPDVEQVLREVLALDGSGSRKKGSGGKPGKTAASKAASSQSGSLLERILALPEGGGPALGVDPHDIKISSNAAANTILVVAPKEAITFIGGVIDQLENQDLPERIAKHYELKYAGADEVADYLIGHFNDQQPGSGSGSPSAKKKGKGGKKASGGGMFNMPTFVAYQRLNLLSVQATEEQIAEIDELIARLDVQGGQDDWVTIHLVQADAGEIVATLTDMFGGGGGAARNKKKRSGSTGSAAQPKFVGEEGGRIVFYSAPHALHERIESVIKELEDQSKNAAIVRVIRLEYAKADSVADAIESAYGGHRGGGRQGRGKKGGSSGAGFNIVANAATRSLFVFSDDATFEKIESLVKSIDQPRDIGFDVKIFPLQYADARTVYTLMGSLVTDYLRKVGKGAKNMEAFSVEVEETANALIVLGNPTVFGFVENALTTIDVPAAAQGKHQSHVVMLQNADADAIAKTLNEVLVRSKPKKKGDQTQPITIAALAGSKAVLVKCNDKDFAEIESVIKKMDSDIVSVGEEVRVVTLLYGDATEMQTAMQEYLQKPGKGGRGRGSDLAGGVRISLLTRGNALVISGDKEKVDRLESIVRELDIAGEEGSAPKLIALKHANVGQILPMLQQMFTNQTPGGRRGKTAPVMVANETLNALMVKAGPTDLSAIRAAIEQMDTPESANAKTFRLVQVEPGLNLDQIAIDVADAVNSSAQALSTSSRSGGGGRGVGRNVSQIMITPNRRTSTLLLAGSTVLFDQAEQIIKTYEKLGPAGGITTAILRPKNIPIEEIQRLIDQLTEQGTSSRGSSSRRSAARRPSSGGVRGAGNRSGARRPSRPRTPARGGRRP